MGKMRYLYHALFLGLSFMILEPHVTLSEGLPPKSINIMIVSKLPAEAIPAFQEIMLEYDTSGRLNKFTSDPMMVNTVLIVVSEWSDLLNIDGMSGVDILLSETKGVDSDQNILQPLISANGGKKVIFVIYKMGDSSLSRYECVARDFFERVSGNREGLKLNWDTCECSN